MIRTTINIKHNTDIAKYDKLRAFLKKQSDGYRGKKSKILTGEEVNHFINNGPDHIYLATKVAVILGIMGACRKQELDLMKVQNIDNLGSAIIINVPNTKTKEPRQFTITGKFYTLFKKYVSLRPPDIATNSIFINFQNGRCTKQVIRINKLRNMPKQVAQFLNLPNPGLYTSRRISATMIVDSGVNIETLKRHGGWKSTETAEGYIDNSLQNRLNVSSQIMS